MNQIKIGKPAFFLFLLFFTYGHLQAQTYAQKQITVQKVFDDLVNAYGNAKAAPQLQLLPNTQKERVVAAYSTTPKPTIKVDEQLIDICLQLKADSLNALATIISHELAHYYNDHTFCSDYAYVLGNGSLSKALRSTNKFNKLEKETEADYQGLWHAAMAGYYAFDIFDKLIDKIYSRYKLPEAINGYPTKSERKAINKERQQKVSALLPVFETGVILTYTGKFEEAINCLNYLNKFFPSRENYNNIGTVRLLWAIQLKPQQAIEFIYPIEIDPISRLKSTGTRSHQKDEQSQMNNLLQSAKRDFEKAISLDPSYAKAYINLACVYDLIGNYEAAIGRIKDMPANVNETISALEIKAIAYAHADNAPKAEECFLEIQKLTNDTGRYNYKMIILGSQSLLASEKFKEEWLNQNPTDSTQFIKIMNEVRRIITADIKIKPYEVITKINEPPFFSIKSKFTQNVKELFVQKQGRVIQIRKYLLLDKFIHYTGFQNWHIINKQPLVILQKVKDGNYVITID
jgi:tetratricopeptide (TPR) repeat protein